ncbi:hypothetical protein HK405_012101, partial [Cladochytrium tenue]
TYFCNLLDTDPAPGLTLADYLYAFRPAISCMAGCVGLLERTEQASVAEGTVFLLEAALGSAIEPEQPFNGAAKAEVFLAMEAVLELTGSVLPLLGPAEKQRVWEALQSWLASVPRAGGAAPAFPLACAQRVLLAVGGGSYVVDVKDGDA